MSFERGKDPKESMEIGRQKDAIQCLGVKYYTNGQEISITDPEIIRIFLEQFTTYQLPINPIFGPQRIIVLSSEKYLDDSVSKVAAMYSPPGNTTPYDPIEKERSIDLNIFDYEGKTIIFNKKMYAMPDLQKLKEKGYGYFEICENNHVLETTKLLKEKKDIMYAQMEAMKVQMNAQYGSIAKTLGNTERLISPYNPPDENKPCIPEKKRKNGFLI